MHRTSLLLPFALLLAGACGDNRRGSSGTAELADADPELLVRALDAASGADAATAYDLAQQLAASGGPASCPSVQQDGSTTIITGGCESSAGPIAGRVVLEDSAADRAAMQRVRFEGFSDSTRAIAGTIDRAPDGSAMYADLAIEAGGIRAVSSLALACNGNGLCAAGDDAWIEVTELGTIDVLGAWRNAPAGGYLTLVGAQTLTLDLNAIDGGCIPYTVDGADAGALCR